MAVGGRSDTPARRPRDLLRAKSPAPDDDAGGSDRDSCIRDLTPTSRVAPPEAEGPVSGEVPSFVDEPEIEFAEEDRPSHTGLLEVESYRALPTEDVWPDLHVDEDRFDEGAGENAPETIREFQRVPSDSARFDDRIREYLDVAREAAEPHLLVKKKK
jgi:hypothetical protein